MRIAFLLHDLNGTGTADRATADLASALGATHDVELAVVRDPHATPAGRPRPRLTPGVTLGPVIDSRHRVAAYLRRTDADVVIATRPTLVRWLAEYGHDRYVRIGRRSPEPHAHLPGAVLARLDAFAATSDADAARHRAALPPGATTRVVAIPGPAPAVTVGPASGASRTIVAAGRLIPVGRHELLVDAFATLAPRRPDWSLRIYGEGRLAGRLRQRIDDLGLYNRVRLMGALPPMERMETEWIKGAIAAVTTSGEPFDRTLLEAMSCGLPVVSTDCAFGSAGVITHGTDGLLVPRDGGSEAYADALLRLIDSPADRRRMGAAALRTAAAHGPAHAARSLAELAATLRRRPRRLRSVLRLRSAPPARPTEPDGRPRARGHCTVAPDGSLTVVLAPDTLPPAGQSDFVAQRREDPDGHRIRVPIRRAPGTGETAVTLDRASRVLPEGRWDCYVEPRDEGLRRRIAADTIDAAALVTLAPTENEHGVSCWLPYTTADGDLTLRTWLRRVHAEVERVTVADGAATVTAVLLGPGARRCAVREAEAVAIARSGDGGDLRMPLRALPDGRVAFTFSYADALARRTAAVRRDVWDLKLRLGPSGRGLVPVGRIGGDTIDLARTDAFPPVALGGTWLRPFFTAQHGLAVAADAVG
ncbi:glycosyltransferase [Streptomyces avicenniae]|uniref:glycosyltransferase n=1 Tax=Streptomyces avicenniae TaxID=500153 RepID=UPI00069A0509|nr:glycosyltransferase [Streptomyces avicenniae]